VRSRTPSAQTACGKPAISTSPSTTAGKWRARRAETRDILLNKEVIAVDQDSLGVQGTIVQASPSELQVWVKPLADGSRAVLLFNRAPVSSTITTDWGRVGLKTTKARVRDLWAHTDSASVESRYAATVPSHGVVMLRVWPMN
jgi:alpha-galactosidase